MALDALAFLRFPIFFAIAAYLLNSPREMKRVSSASVAPPLAGTPPKGDGATLQNSRRHEGLRSVFLVRTVAFMRRLFFMSCMVRCKFCRRRNFFFMCKRAWRMAVF